MCNWLKANKISLNCDKTELIIFRHPNKQLNYDLRIKINGKKLLPSLCVKYLGITLDCHLNWSYQVDSLSTKLAREVGMLSKIRHYVSETTLRNIYFGIFSSLLSYGSQIWGQFSNQHIFRIQKLQNKAIRVINFAKFDDPTDPLYQKSKFLKLSDNVKLQNFFYVHNSIKGNLPVALTNSFQVAADSYSHNTRGASQFKMALPKVRTLTYGINSIRYRSAADWNLMVSEFPDKTFQRQSKPICKKIIENYILDNYHTPEN